MIKSFRSKAIAELWTKASTAKVDFRLQKRIMRRLEVPNAAGAPEEMNVPGHDFHALKAFLRRDIPST